MLKAEIKELMKAGTEVAVRLRGASKYETPRRAMITDMDMPIKVGYRTKPVGVRVTLTETFGDPTSIWRFDHGKVGDTHDVSSRQIVSTWAAYEAEQQASAERRAQAEVAREAFARRVEAAESKLREATNLPVRLSSGRRGFSASITGTLTHLEQLIDMLAKGGE